MSGNPFEECMQLQQADRDALKDDVMSSSEKLLQSSSEAANRVAGLKHMGFTDEAKIVQDYSILILGSATANQLRQYRARIVEYDNAPPG